MRNISEQTVGRSGEALGWSSRIMGLTRVLGGILFFALLHNPVQAVLPLTLAWDAKTLTGWTVIGTVTVGVGGSLDFTDTNAGSLPKRFYRTHEKP